MTDEDKQEVTLVTRNDSGWKLLLDLGMTAAAFYYISHPDCIENLKERASLQWQRLIHKVSVWQTAQAIESLPETDSGDE